MPDRYARLSGTAVATITSGQSLSSAIDVSDMAILTVYMPAAWDSAAITFTASATQTGTYGSVYDDAGTEVSITSANAVAGRVIVDKTILEQLAGLRWLKVRSGTTATPVNQTADRAITVGYKS